MFHAQGHTGGHGAVVRSILLLLEEAGKNAGGDVADAVKNLVQGFRRPCPVPLGLVDFPAEPVLAQIRQFHYLLEKRMKHAGLHFPGLLFIEDVKQAEHAGAFAGTGRYRGAS